MLLALRSLYETSEGVNATVVIVGIVSALGNGNETVLADSLRVANGIPAGCSLGNEAVMADGLIAQTGETLTSEQGNETVFGDSLRMTLGILANIGKGYVFVIAERTWTLDVGPMWGGQIGAKGQNAVVHAQGTGASAAGGVI